MHHRINCTIFIRASIYSALALSVTLPIHAQTLYTQFTAAAAMHATRSGLPGYLGVGTIDVPDDQVSALKIPPNHGTIIVSIDHDAPAGKCGLREHDVILQVNSIVIESSQHFHHVMHAFTANTNLSLLISRDGQQQTIAVRLADRRDVEREAWHEPFIPPPDDTVVPGPDSPVTQSAAPAPPPAHGFAAGIFAGPLIGPRPTYTGAMLESVGQLADMFGVKPGLGLLVKNVDPNSPAAAAGLKPGDIITRVNATNITRPDDWFHAVREAKGHALTLNIIRNKQPQSITLTPTEYHRNHGALRPTSRPTLQPAPQSAPESASPQIGMQPGVAPGLDAPHFDNHQIDDAEAFNNAFFTDAQNAFDSDAFNSDLFSADTMNSIDSEVFSADDTLANPAAVATTINDMDRALQSFFAENLDPDPLI
jgi:serine protease Do